MNLLAPAKLSARGHHPLGLLGLGAGALGLLMLVISSLGARPDALRGGDPVAAEASARLRLERQRAEIDDRLARFPGADQRAAQISAIASLATEHGVKLGSGEYRSVDSPMPAELATLELRLPLHGEPAAVRGFLAGLQRELPWLAIDRLGIERGNDGWSGELQGRLFLRRPA